MPRLVAAGHEVCGMTRSDVKRTAVAALAAVPVVADVLDGDPAAVAEWLSALAQQLSATKPPRVPRLAGCLFAGQADVTMMTDVRSASNVKAKRELGWRPAHQSWRQGFAAA